MEFPWLDPAVQLISHAMAESHHQLLGTPLLALATTATPPRTAAQLAKELYLAPCALLCHDTGADPRFIYANLAAQNLFSRPWQEFIGLPSRYSAEPDSRERREQMLAEVARRGFLTDYRGIRVAADGRRLAIEDTTVWNVANSCGGAVGQGARIGRWQFLTAESS